MGYVRNAVLANIPSVRNAELLSARLNKGSVAGTSLAVGGGIVAGPSMEPSDIAHNLANLSLVSPEVALGGAAFTGAAIAMKKGLKILRESFGVNTKSPFPRSQTQPNETAKNALGSYAFSGMSSAYAWIGVGGVISGKPLQTVLGAGLFGVTEFIGRDYGSKVPQAPAAPVLGR